MARLTQDAYIKGLKDGYRLAEAQYCDPNDSPAIQAIEHFVCKPCSKYTDGKFSEDCRLCKVSQCCHAINLYTKDIIESGD